MDFDQGTPNFLCTKILAPEENLIMMPCFLLAEYSRIPASKLDQDCSFSLISCKLELESHSPLFLLLPRKHPRDNYIMHRCKIVIHTSLMGEKGINLGGPYTF